MRWFFHNTFPFAMIGLDDNSKAIAAKVACAAGDTDRRRVADQTFLIVDGGNQDAQQFFQDVVHDAFAFCLVGSRDRTFP